MGDLRYCFEQERVLPMLRKMKDGLAVIDSDGISETAIKDILKKNSKLLIYDYLNAGALEQERSYYNDFKHLRLAKYSGWAGEYWIDVTDKKWQEHLIEEARKKKAKGAIGLYFDNADIYYMCAEGFKEEKTNTMRKVPASKDVYNALKYVVKTIVEDIGLVVMPNGGGGNGYESYTAAWYFGLKHTKLDCWERGKKGIIITMGDEPLNPVLHKNQVNAVFGDTVEADVKTENLYKMATEKFDIYHIAVDDPADCYAWYENAINRTFKPVLGNRLKVSTIERLPMTIVDCIEDSVNGGAQTEAMSNVEKTESGYITW